MATWEPPLSFEDKVLLLQPNHNFIFAELCKQENPIVHNPRPKDHLDYAKQHRLANKRRNNQDPGIASKLDAIETVQRITGTKTLGHLPALEDWDNDDTVEQETVALMRHYGFGPSIDHPLNEMCTRGSTMPVFSSGMHIMSNGRVVRPLFYDEKFFKMDDIPELPLPMPMDNEASTSSSSSSSAVNSDITTSNESFKTAKSTNTSYASALCDLNLDDDDEYPSLQTPKFIPTRNWYRSRKAVENDKKKQLHVPPKTKPF